MKSIVFKLATLFVISSLLLACDSTPIINGTKPFVVTKIDNIGNGMCEYYGDETARWDGSGFSGRPSIVLPSRMYNIGDTILIKKR